MRAAASSAVTAAVAVARAHGVQCDEPVVLRDAWHVLVHLAPAPVVARVSSNAPTMDPQDVARELAVATHAARAGAPVVAPSDLLDPGPHEHGGHTLAFWTYVADAKEPDAGAAGEALRAIHEALADFEGDLSGSSASSSVMSCCTETVTRISTTAWRPRRGPARSGIAGLRRLDCGVVAGRAIEASAGARRAD